jgi:beta-N-acetylhexosaminidase
LLHQAGLVAYIPFFKETIDANGKPLPQIYSTEKNDSFSIEVLPNLFLKNSWQDTIYSRILQSPVGPTGKYIYSDNDFIFLGKIIERITGLRMDKYVEQTFYKPMQLTTIGYDPLLRNSVEDIAPTEQEKYFRNTTVRGSVHDPGAALMNGIAGHAGLFSNMYDIAAVMQMLLNCGVYNNQTFLKPETINYFNKYHSKNSRRGLGFDKPEKDNAIRKEPYPAALASELTFGHTGFTGTCAWADPKAGLVFVFLSNRVNPEVNSIFSKMNIRGKVMDEFYRVIGL